MAEIVLQWWHGILAQERKGVSSLIRQIATFISSAHIRSQSYKSVLATYYSMWMPTTVFRTDPGCSARTRVKHHQNRRPLCKSLFPMWPRKFILQLWRRLQQPTATSKRSLFIHQGLVCIALEVKKVSVFTCSYFETFRQTNTGQRDRLTSHFDKSRKHIIEVYDILVL